MFTKIIKFCLGFAYFLIVFCLIVVFSTKSIAQNCNQNLDFNFKASTSGINWIQFPDFTLPFKIVYQGPSWEANNQKILKSGFSHISNPINIKDLPTKNRAYMFANVASISQPLESHKSPWGNNLNEYYTYWDTKVAESFYATNSSDFLDADILMFDIETQIRHEDSILNLKNKSFVPNVISTLNNKDFVLQYKKDLQNIYSIASNYFLTKSKFSGSLVSAYGDTPIWNTFVNIQGKTWNQWKSDANALNPLCVDLTNGNLGGSYYNTLTTMAPSSYFYYDYPHQFAGEYLAYLMFQIEANKAWSSKDIMLFVWQKYNTVENKTIKPWMAEAMAIFPFMCGAKGIWMWEDERNIALNENLSNYEFFTKGLYRLSKFKSIFEGNYKIIEAISAREYDENRFPIWRGVINNNKILIAAHNPWAIDEHTKTVVNIQYENIKKTIELTGYEVFLCEYDLDALAQESQNQNKLNVYPNPGTGNFTLKLYLENYEPITIEAFDFAGKLLHTEKYTPDNLLLLKTLVTENVNAQEIVVKVTTSTNVFSKKVILFKNE